MPPAPSRTAAASRKLLAELRGYCAGVDRAVGPSNVPWEARRAGHVRHEIVHNRHVVETLARRGAVFVKDRDEVPGRHRGVLRTAWRRRCTSRPPPACLQVIDATRPLVTKVHNEAKRFAREDYDILLIGHEGTKGGRHRREAPDHRPAGRRPGRRGLGDRARREQGDLALPDR